MSSVDPKSKSSKKYNLRTREKKHEKNLSKKVDGSSDDENEWVTSDEEVEDSAESGDFNDAEFKKFLGKMFPSKHLAKRIKEMDKIDKKMDSIAQKKSVEKSKKTPKKQMQVEESEEESDDSEDDSEYDSEYDDDGGKSKVQYCIYHWRATQRI